MEVERAFRVLRSLVNVRPIYHHRDRRVETHIFMCFLAYRAGPRVVKILAALGLRSTTP